MNLYMTSCSESTKLANVLTTDPESDDESILINPLSQSLHTPDMSRSLCFELSSTIVCTCALSDCSVIILLHVIIKLLSCTIYYCQKFISVLDLLGAVKCNSVFCFQRTK